MAATSPTYRPEIDGLRAVAVLPVVLYHAGLPGFHGGFIGVDIFFVISGYLITRIILAEQAEGCFSLWRFYERRARRILPALFLVAACCLPPAWLWMSPDALQNFGQSLTATVFSANNILLWLTSGYWALEAEFKPLMHSWSLGVEEQFYLLYPLLLIALWRSGVRLIGILLAVLALTSLVLAEFAGETLVECGYDQIAGDVSGRMAAHPISHDHKSGRPGVSA